MSLSRRAFYQKMGAVGGALALAQLCGGCESGAPVDGSVTATNGAATLTFAAFPALGTVGGGVVVDVAGGKPLVVVRTGETTATALSAVCTHEGCTVDYVGGGVPISCPCHDSTFAISGAVVRGPARTALAVHAAVVGSDGITVTV